MFGLYLMIISACLNQKQTIIGAVLSHKHQDISVVGFRINLCMSLSAWGYMQRMIV